jgi:hypothetical protein
LPWQDGSVIRAFGPDPIIKRILAALALPKDTLLIVDPEVKDMWLTTITKITEETFRKWPRKIERDSRLRAKLVSRARAENE